jgi:hypothetical protein
MRAIVLLAPIVGSLIGNFCVAFTTGGLFRTVNFNKLRLNAAPGPTRQSRRRQVLWLRTAKSAMMKESFCTTKMTKTILKMMTEMDSNAQHAKVVALSEIMSENRNLMWITDEADYTDAVECLIPQTGLINYPSTLFNCVTVKSGCFSMSQRST